MKNEESKNKVGAGAPYRPSPCRRVGCAHGLHGGGRVRRLDVWQLPRCLSRARTDHHASSLTREAAMAAFAKKTRACRPSSPKRSNFSTTDSGRLSLYKLDAGSQHECNAHRDHRSGGVRNARQGPANPENSWRIGAPLVGLRTYAPKRYEPLRASHGCAQNSKRSPRGAGHHERMPVMLG